MLLAHLTSSTEIKNHEICMEYHLHEGSDHWWISVLKEQININTINAIIKSIKRLAKLRGQKLNNITLVVNDTINVAKVKNTDGIRVTAINFYRMVVYYHKYHATRYINSTKVRQKFNTTYKPNQHQALFLVGKPYQPHRTPILIEAIERGLKNRLVYSWNPGKPGSEVFNRVKECVARVIGERDMVDFGNQHHSWLDISKDFPVINKEENFFHYSGFPFDKELFKNTSLSIVPETNHIKTEDLDLSWTTEKIWRAIANHHPFVLIGEPGIVSRLRSFGYDTWDAFLKHDQYYANSFWNNIDNQATKLAVDNVEYFLNQDLCIDNISDIAKNNSDLMDQQTKEEIAVTFDNDYSKFEFFISSGQHSNLDEGKGMKDVINDLKTLKT